MSTLSEESDNGSGSSPNVHSAGPEMIQLLPAQAIEKVVVRTNKIISEHRRWLADLPNRPTPTSSSLTTPPPSLSKRFAAPIPLPDPQVILPECNALITSASNAGFAAGAVSVSAQLSVSLANAAATAAASIASLQAALAAANDSLESARVSAQQALDSASQSIQAALQTASQQSQAAQAASASLTAGLASAQNSADQAIAGVQATANASIASVQESARVAIASAEAVASNARATATNVINQAQASISAALAQASADTAASRIDATNTTKFVLIVTFSIFGSSLLTILFFYLVMRYRRVRLAQRQNELKSSIRRHRPESDSSSVAPSLSDFPYPSNRTHWSEQRNTRRRSMAGERETGYWPKDNERISAIDRQRESMMREGENVRRSQSLDLPVQTTRETWSADQTPRVRQRRSTFANLDDGNLPTGNFPGRQTWSPYQDLENVARSEAATLVTMSGFPSSAPSRDGPRTAGGMSARSVMVRKNALTYDADYPDQPPKFMTWFEESFRSTSPLPEVRSVVSQRPEVREMAETRQSTLIVGRGSGAGPGARGDSDGSRFVAEASSFGGGERSTIGTAM